MGNEIENLKHPQPATVLAAIDALAREGETAVPALPKLMDLWVGSTDATISDAAWTALAAIDPNWARHPLILAEIYPLIFELGDGLRSARAEKVLACIGRQAYSYLIDAATSVSESTRDAANRTLITIDPDWAHDPEAADKIDDLLEKLDSKHEAVVKAAEAILVAIGLPFASVYFPQVLHVNADRRKHAHRLLQRISKEWHHEIPALELVPPMVNGLSHKSTEVSSAAFQLLSQIGGTARPFLTDALEPHATTSVPAKIAVVKLLGLHAADDDRTLALVAATWKAAENPDLVAACIVALRRMSYSEPLLVDELIQHLGHDNLHVRVEAIGYLGDLGSQAARAALALGLQLADKNEEVVTAAQSSLRLIGKSAGSGLIPILNGESEAELGKLVGQYLDTYFPREMNRAVLDATRAIDNMAWARLHLADSFQRFRDRKRIVLELIHEIGFRQMDLVTPLQAILSGDDEEMKTLARKIYGEIKL